MENLKELKLKDVSFEEKQELNGGGWIADATEWFVTQFKCGCNATGGSWNSFYGGVQYPQE